jgi:hypothetical protein
VDLCPLFDRFIDKAPLAVAARALAGRVLDPDALDLLFEGLALDQYERHLRFSTLVGLLTAIAFRTYRSVLHAYEHMADEVGVTSSALYQKLNGLEPHLGGALVRHGAGQVRQAVDALDAALPPWREGFRVRILDGNHFSGTQHRLAVLRGSGAAALPGQCLAVLDPQARLITDLVPCEDAYTQERKLIDQVLPTVEANDVWVADRNLCTPRFLTGIAQPNAFFVIREHAQLNIRPLGEARPCGRCPTGTLSEQDAEVYDEQTGRSVKVRRVVVALDGPTRDGDTEVSVLTNLPAEVADAAAVAGLYLTRWTIEAAFGELTVALRCEVNTLGYPKAALFCFAVACLASNVLAGVRAALRAAHGSEKVEAELSVEKLAREVSGKQEGMMVALPAERWQPWLQMTAERFARWLRQLAAQADWRKLKKSRRGPKKPPPKKTFARWKRHVSTKRLLDERQSK